MSLPNCILAGVPKSGTTSLYYYLGQHPEVFVTDKKEPRYLLIDTDQDGRECGMDPDTPFDILPIKIRKLDDYIAIFDAVAGQKAVIDASTYYAYSRVAIKRIHQLMPEAKILFSLRDPISRAYSDYLMNLHQGRETREAGEALVEGEFYVECGRYYSYLVPWFETFDPTQIKIVLFDDLKKDALAVHQDICRFFAIDDTHVPDLTIRMKGGKPKNEAVFNLIFRAKKTSLYKKIYPKLPTSVYKTWREVSVRYVFEKDAALPTEVSHRLYEYYRDEIEQLEGLLGRDLTGWKLPDKHYDALSVIESETE